MAKKAKKTTKSLVISEKFIESQIFSYLKILGIYCFKHDSVGIFDPVRKIYRTNKNPHRLKGVSDILGIIPGTGKLLAIEVKTHKGVATTEQKIFLDTIQKNGGIGFIARTLEDVTQNLKNHLPGWECLKFNPGRDYDFDNEH